MNWKLKEVEVNGIKFVTGGIQIGNYPKPTGTLNPGDRNPDWFTCKEDWWYAHYVEDDKGQPSVSV